MWDESVHLQEQTIVVYIRCQFSRIFSLCSLLSVVEDMFGGARFGLETRRQNKRTIISPVDDVYRPGAAMQPPSPICR